MGARAANLQEVLLCFFGVKFCKFSVASDVIHYFSSQLEGVCSFKACSVSLLSRSLLNDTVYAVTLEITIWSEQFS